ncbi:BQ5605_C043g12117 [Microbotryum silenes-dioicae]|uniref:BQ5605_C043g12117 protein n=1 Tax=Microbotryum silenes-dioicae TaxID=796604 RepID=A0A2X0NID5_9BASI|nr:BQ5605_C043g12117 [Microbotryum silenes-dioicae]
MKRYRGQITQLLWFYRTLYAHPVTSSGSDWMICTKVELGGKISLIVLYAQTGFWSLA